MQVTVESTGPLKREMKVMVPEERIAGEVQNRLKSMSKTTKIQGFRQGKVPFKVIETRYGKQVRMEVVGEVVQSSFYEALQKEDLKPAGRPQIDPLDAEQGQGLKYTASFEVMPEVTLTAAEKLEIEKPVCKIGEDDYNKMVEVLRKQRQSLNEVDRAAKSGDTVEIDFEGEIDGEAFEGGSAKEFKLELGLNRFIDGFEEGLTGKKPGDEVSLDLKFPDEYQSEKLAGKPVTFKVKVNKVLEPILPELNQEFFEGFGLKEGGEEAFKNMVMEHMNREAGNAIKRRQRDAVMNALHAANSIELPDSLVQEEAHRIYHQFQDQLKSYGVNAPREDCESGHDLSMFTEQAQKRVALQLIVMEIINKQGLKADASRVRALIEQNASGYEDPSAVINWYYNDKNRLAEVEAVVLEDEVVGWVCENARVKEVNVPFDELMNKGQTGTN
ncbi:MAG: trigger factor [Gammaproteobacteria bacterium]